MKTNRMILMLAVAAAVAACNQAEIDAPSELNDNQFTASVPVTKVSMNEDFSLFWEEGDEVSVFAPDGSNNLFTSDAQTGAATTVLHGGADFVVDPAQTYYAIYPYSADNTISVGKITTVIPVVQTPKVGTFPVNHAVAVSSGKNLAFYNVCGLIGFEITRDDIVSVTLKSAGEQEYLTGKVEITCQTEPSYAVLDGHTEVTLVTQDKFVTGKYYVAVLPQTFTGMTVTMYKKDGTVASRTNTAGFTLERSKRVMIGAVDGGEFGANKITTISNASELQGFLAAADSYSVDDEVTLAADIDLKGYDIVPAVSFAGTFDGAGKSIKNWNTTTALFNEVSGTVKNLTIAESCNLEVQVKGDAAFIALSNTGTISGCTNYGTVTSVNESFVPDVTEVYNDRAIGTIAAVSTGSIVLCENHGTVTITPASVGRFALQFIGGVAGKASATADVNALESCTNNGAVTFDGPFSSKLFIGGVCGGTPAGAGTFGDYGIFKGLTNKAPVTLEVPSNSSVPATYINLGGVIGYAEADLDNCDNEGAVTVDLPTDPSTTAHSFQRPAIAGVVGNVLYDVKNCENKGNISVVGAFGGTNNKDEGVGQHGHASFAGVAAIAGNVPGTNVVNNCQNSGKITLDLGMHSDASSHGLVGGIVGYANAKVTDCSTSGDGMDINCQMRYGIVGGIVAEAHAAMSGCTNSAPIDYDFVITEENGNQSEYVDLGGVVGQLITNAQTAISNCANTASIKVSNGYYADDHDASSIGGLIGMTTFGRVTGGSSSSDAVEIIGTYTIRSNVKMYFGGIIGVMEGSGSGTVSRGLLSLTRSGNMTIENPGKGSRIGGICGARFNADQNDAYLNLISSDFSVTCSENSDNDIYVGMVYGEYEHVSATRTSHTITLDVDSYTATNVTASGLAIGLLSGNIKVGGSSTQPFTVRPFTFNSTTIDGTTQTEVVESLLVGQKDGTLTIGAIVVQELNPEA